MKILVPIDFTPVTENAFRYALGMNDISRHQVVLLHVTATDQEGPAALTRLKELADKYNTQAEPVVKTGNIFDHIGETALQIGASLIVMGTHGIKGMQHIIGSRAMRVITNSQTPYIVVQKKPYTPVKKILVPVDFTREGKQMLPFLTSVAEYFNATLYLLTERSSDSFIQNKIDNNLQYFRSFLNDNNISFNVLQSNFGSSKYKGIMKEADTINADMIVTTIDPETGVTDYIMGVDEQKIVANESEIPVLCINTKNILSKTGNIFEYTF